MAGFDDVAKKVSSTCHPHSLPPARATPLDPPAPGHHPRSPQPLVPLSPIVFLFVALLSSSPFANVLMSLTALLATASRASSGPAQTSPAQPPVACYYYGCAAFGMEEMRGEESRGGIHLHVGPINFFFLLTRMLHQQNQLSILLRDLI